MAGRRPVDVRKFVTSHNLAMALLSLWMVIETLRSVSTPSTPHIITSCQNSIVLYNSLISTYWEVCEIEQLEMPWDTQESHPLMQSLKLDAPCNQILFDPTWQWMAESSESHTMLYSLGKQHWCNASSVWFQTRISIRQFSLNAEAVLQTALIPSKLAGDYSYRSSR